MRTEYAEIIELIRSEVKPALGCTEPIAVSLAVARSCEELRKLGEDVNKIEIEVSPNILKNGMGVGIPSTGMVGLDIAAALGAVCGKAEYKLEVLKDLNPESIERAKKMVDDGVVFVDVADTDIKLFIRAICYSKSHKCLTEIQGSHDNIVLVELDDKVIGCCSPKGIAVDCCDTKQAIELTVRKIYDFAIGADFKDIEFILESGRMNKKIAEEGLKNDYGLKVGRTIYKGYIKNKDVFGGGMMTYAMAMTAAASDARMAGSILPAMSNSGSGNQGITATIPVISMAEKLGSTEEQLCRALIISHLVSIHIKQSLGRLSALCGCVVASSGSACGIVYLMGGGYDQMTYAIKNMVGNLTGMVCDGAKVGCALKVSSGVSAAIQAAMLAVDDICISENDGIIDSDIEKTIKNLSTIGTEGMCKADEMMLKIMVNKKNKGCGV